MQLDFGLNIDATKFHMTSSIDYEKIKSFLAEASLFELSRFQTMLQNELDNPMRVAAVKNQFKEGDTIQYFHGI